MRVCILSTFLYASNWVVVDTFLAVGQGNQAFIYKRNSFKRRYEIHIDCPSNNIDTPLDDLCCFEVPAIESQDKKKYILVGSSSASQKVVSWILKFKDDSNYDDIEVELLGTDSIAHTWTVFSPLTNYASPHLSLYMNIPLERRYMFATCQGSDVFFWSLKRPLEEFDSHDHSSQVWQPHGPIQCKFNNIKMICGMNNNSVAIGLWISWSTFETRYTSRY
jgi:hypothetical protein